MSIASSLQPARWRRGVHPLVAKARERQRRRRMRSSAALTLVLMLALSIWGSQRGGAGQRLIVRNATQSAIASQSTGVLPNPCALLTNAQVGGLVGGRVASRSRESSQVCSWIGPVLGPLSITGTEFDLQVSRESRASFEAEYTRSAQQSGIAQASRVSGMGHPAFSQYNGHSLYVWDNGIVIALDGYNLSVYPKTVKHLVRLAFSRVSTR